MAQSTSNAITNTLEVSILEMSPEQTQDSSGEEEEDLLTTPQTKEELRIWLEEYCRGEKNHGEPKTWDVTNVTDMSELFKDMETFNEPIDQCFGVLQRSISHWRSTQRR